MTAALSPATRRFAAISLLLAACALVWMIAIAPLLDIESHGRAMAERLTLVTQRDRSEEREIAALQQQMYQLKQRRTAGIGLLPGDNDSLAAAQIQSRIRAVLNSPDGELRSVQVLPAHDEGAFRRVTVRGQMAMTLTALQRAAYDLESTVPYLLLDNIDLRAEVRSRGGSGDPRLEVRFDVTGYMRKGP